MRSGLALLVVAMALIVGAVCRIEAADEPEFTSLFDGKTLRGWVPERTDRFAVKDGVLVNDGGTGWLRSEKSYRDFELDRKSVV